MSSPTSEEILYVADKAVDTFRDRRLRCCLFGSTACYLFGVSRTPNDVDLVVFTNRYDAEELKEMLVEDDSDFYLVPSRNPTASYSVLWYRLPSSRRRRRKCKVDILVPPTLNIPHVPGRRIKIISDLPLMPLIPLLLLKLQGWSDHRESHREDMQEKQYVDVQDISELLEIAIDRGQDVRQDNLGWIPEQLRQDAQDRVWDFVEEYPDTAENWMMVGFNA
ncbi:hypothetical protein ONZ51_g8102 [Trametes cubensis]|uniref:Uncharacterized protein n=1 Tax=Trametes cubensis TaxID=1111947 RepID=A0AAD7TNW5_9APHY|nr:hypothetical protein ONZ51_g8102 [Trametes cubensis]